VPLLKIDQKLESILLIKNGLYEYCHNIKNRPEVRKHITDSEWGDILRKKGGNIYISPFFCL
jgi:hypothetical protein